MVTWFPGARGTVGFLGGGGIWAGKGEGALLGSALIGESGGKCQVPLRPARWVLALDQSDN